MEANTPGKVPFDHIDATAKDVAAALTYGNCRHGAVSLQPLEPQADFN